MPDLFRVKDLRTGHQYTTGLVESYHEELDKPAVDEFGAPLPAKHNLNYGAKAESGGYSSATVGDLEVEVQRRNAGRAGTDLVIADGTTKADLVAALKADDTDNPPIAPPDPDDPPGNDTGNDTDSNQES